MSSSHTDDLVASLVRKLETSIDNNATEFLVKELMAAQKENADLTKLQAEANHQQQMDTLRMQVETLQAQVEAIHNDQTTDLKKREADTEKKSSSMVVGLIQSGRHVHCVKGSAVTVCIPTSFHRPYGGQLPPKVQVALDQVDLENKYLTKVKVTAEDITQTGFNLSLSLECHTVVPPSLQLPVLNPPEEQRFYSSVHCNHKIGTGCARSMLDSPQGWLAGVKDGNQWMVMDAGMVVDAINGIVITNRKDCWFNQVVTKVEVDVSDDTGDWKKAMEATDTNITVENNISWLLFDQPVPARFVRIRVLQWEDHISMRCALILQGAASKTKDVEYRVVKDPFIYSRRSISVGVGWTAFPAVE
ncbi:Discoidin-1 subunit [Seminavis robusta]|uniref:Discoidin-1 subunit n=1 Tax=Seminavis robusta TaxID=568900 RepID=A0A9N8ECG7_9STRA|nr:Discoidin-1 subunit [Seminavis robusta]|eukprot:Sro921_g220370.1 Discoidin-1 subunit (360) ;mRNA; f:18036-19115